jgi:hypothetical protein
MFVGHMPFRVTTRAGAHVERHAAPDLEGALERLEAEARAAAAGPGLGAVDLRARRYEAGDRVAARVQLAGPQRWRPAVRAGLDVRGDGSVRAWTTDGATGRTELEPRPGEDAYAALRRALTG